jgi:hypothetical protein
MSITKGEQTVYLHEETIPYVNTKHKRENRVLFYFYVSMSECQHREKAE